MAENPLAMALMAARPRGPTLPSDLAQALAGGNPDAPYPVVVPGMERYADFPAARMSISGDPDKMGVAEPVLPSNPWLRSMAFGKPMEDTPEWVHGLESASNYGSMVGGPMVGAIRAFHGTTRPAARSLAEEGFAIPKSGETAAFLTDSPHDAYRFAAMKTADKTQRKILKADVDTGEFKKINLDGELYDPELMSSIISDAIAEGKPGIVVRNVQNFEGAEPTTSYVVLDPKTVSLFKKYGIAGLTTMGAGGAAATLGLPREKTRGEQGGQLPVAVLGVRG